VKSLLHTSCLQLAAKRIKSLEDELESMRQAVQSESKSSAGDKHETGRAMIHLEQEKLQKQLAEAQMLMAELEQIKLDQPCENVQQGAFVKTNRANFYVAAGLGKVAVGGGDVFVVSSQSPIAKQMLGKRAKDNFNMNGTEYAIIAVE
jgi:transcription elongation GreA/GreB family factor